MHNETRIGKSHVRERHVNEAEGRERQRERQRQRDRDRERETERKRGRRRREMKTRRRETDRERKRCRDINIISGLSHMLQTLVYTCVPVKARLFVPVLVFCLTTATSPGAYSASHFSLA